MTALTALHSHLNIEFNNQVKMHKYSNALHVHYYRPRHYYFIHNNFTTQYVSRMALIWQQLLLSNHWWVDISTETKQYFEVFISGMHGQSCIVLLQNALLTSDY